MSEQKRKRRPRRAYDIELAQDRTIVVGLLSAAGALEQRYPEIGEFVVVRKMLRDAADLFTTMIADANRYPVEEQPPAPRRSEPTPASGERDALLRHEEEARTPGVAVQTTPAPPFVPVDVTQGIDDGF